VHKDARLTPKGRALMRQEIAATKLIAADARWGGSYAASRRLRVLSESWSTPASGRRFRHVCPEGGG
jgi:hypothetical protein